MSTMASGPKSINDLPEEIILEILSNIEPEELFLTIANVCKSWKFLVKSKVLWKRVSYTCDERTDIRRIKGVLTAAPALHSFILRKRRDAACILEFLFHSQCDLRKLSLESCRIRGKGTKLLANIVDLYPDLESLSLHCETFTADIYDFIPRLKKLSELHLGHRVHETSGPLVRWETVCLIADSCQRLTKLRLFEVRLIDSEVIHVINKLGKQLTSLALFGDELTDIAYLYLNNCARLRELEVDCCKGMTDKGLLEGIGSLHELTSLCLTFGVNLTAQALSTFLHRTSMSSIVLLDLTYCSNLDDEGLKGIAERCIHLRGLAVSSCNGLTDAGMTIAIKHCSQLRVLKLMDLHHITGEGWLALLPCHLPHLRELCLDLCTNVRDNYVEELRATVPELKFTSIFGDNV